MYITLLQANLTPAATVLQLKTVFRERTGVSENEQMMFFNDTSLTNESTFSAYGIHIDSAIRVDVDLVSWYQPKATAG